MILLDTEDHWFVAQDRRQLVTALLAHLDADTVDLASLAAACLDVQPLDVVIIGE